MINVLLTNDDGYQSPGFSSIFKELQKDFNVTAVVPNIQKSWQGKAITANKKIMVEKIMFNGKEIYTVDGTPADCVQIGLYNILDKKPQIVISGINEGPNIDRGRILSSGTIGAGFEAVIQGVRAVCSSYSYPQKHDVLNFTGAALITKRFVEKFLDNEYGHSELISINIPHLANSKTEWVTAQKIQKKSYGQLFFKDDDGYYQHQKPWLSFDNPEEGTDVDSLSKNKVVITPINLDL